ncbi:MAG: MFS transporter, partial [Anaerovoracaceae bacterium]
MSKNVKHTKAQRATLRVVVITSFINTFIGSALNIAIPSLENYFDAGASSVGWVVSAYMLTVSALSVPFGKLADDTGRKRIILIGIGGFGLVTALSIFAPSIEIMLI